MSHVVDAVIWPMKASEMKIQLTNYIAWFNFLFEWKCNHEWLCLVDLTHSILDIDFSNVVLSQFYLQLINLSVWQWCLLGYVFMGHRYEYKGSYGTLLYIGDCTFTRNSRGIPSNDSTPMMINWNCWVSRFLIIYVDKLMEESQTLVLLCFSW